MKIILSNHASKRAVEREISKEDIREAIEFPDYIVKKNKKIESHKKIGNKFLKIIYVNKENYIKVITLMWK
jgi:hypothetical protein